jgi:hypothetical protein
MLLFFGIKEGSVFMPNKKGNKGKGGGDNLAEVLAETQKLARAAGLTGASQGATGGGNDLAKVLAEAQRQRVALGKNGFGAGGGVAGAIEEIAVVDGEADVDVTMTEKLKDTASLLQNYTRFLKCDYDLSSKRGLYHLFMDKDKGGESFFAELFNEIKSKHYAPKEITFFANMIAADIAEMFFDLDQQGEEGLDNAGDFLKKVVADIMNNYDDSNIQLCEAITVKLANLALKFVIVFDDDPTVRRIRNRKFCENLFNFYVQFVRDVELKGLRSSQRCSTQNMRTLPNSEDIKSYYKAYYQVKSLALNLSDGMVEVFVIKNFIEDEDLELINSMMQQFCELDAYIFKENPYRFWLLSAYILKHHTKEIDAEKFIKLVLQNDEGFIKAVKEFISKGEGDLQKIIESFASPQAAAEAEEEKDAFGGGAAADATEEESCKLVVPSDAAYDELVLNYFMQFTGHEIQNASKLHELWLKDKEGFFDKFFQSLNKHIPQDYSLNIFKYVVEGMMTPKFTKEEYQSLFVEMFKKFSLEEKYLNHCVYLVEYPIAVEEIKNPVGRINYIVRNPEYYKATMNIFINLLRDSKLREGYIFFAQNYFIKSFPVVKYLPERDREEIIRNLCSLGEKAYLDLFKEDRQGFLAIILFNHVVKGSCLDKEMKFCVEIKIGQKDEALLLALKKAVCGDRKAFEEIWGGVVEASKILKRKVDCEKKLSSPQKKAQYELWQKRMKDLEKKWSQWCSGVAAGGEATYDAEAAARVAAAAAAEKDLLADLGSDGGGAVEAAPGDGSTTKRQEKRERQKEKQWQKAKQERIALEGRLAKLEEGSSRADERLKVVESRLAAKEAAAEAARVAEIKAQHELEAAVAAAGAARVAMVAGASASKAAEEARAAVAAVASRQAAQVAQGASLAAVVAAREAEARAAEIKAQHELKAAAVARLQAVQAAKGASLAALAAARVAEAMAAGAAAEAAIAAAEEKKRRALAAIEAAGGAADKALSEELRDEVDVLTLVSTAPADGSETAVAELRMELEQLKVERGLAETARSTAAACAAGRSGGAVGNVEKVAEAVDDSGYLAVDDSGYQYGQIKGWAEESGFECLPASEIHSKIKNVADELGEEGAEKALNMKGYFKGFHRGCAQGVKQAQDWRKQQQQQSQPWPPQQQSPHWFQQSQPPPCLTQQQSQPPPWSPQQLPPHWFQQSPGWPPQQYQQQLLPQQQQQPYQAGGAAIAVVAAGAAAVQTTEAEREVQFPSLQLGLYRR